MSTSDRLLILAALLAVLFDAPSWLTIALLLVVLLGPVLPFAKRGS